MTGYEKNITIVFCILSFFGCKNDELVKTKNSIKLNKRLYDSIQVFVDTVVKCNVLSNFYLLSLKNKQTDSLVFTIRTIHPKQLKRVYKKYYYFYNKDSSLLLVENNKLVDDSGVENILSNLPIEIPEDTEPRIYNPLIWKLTLIDSEIVMDRTYRMYETGDDEMPPPVKPNY